MLWAGAFFSPDVAAMPRVLIPLQLDDSAPALGAQLHVLEGPTMGTSWQVRWVAGAQPDAQRVREAVQQALDLVVAQMSTWLAGSDLDRYNRAEAGSWHTLPAEFDAVLRAAQQLAQWSDGAFNAASGALVNLWGFGPAPRYTDPGFIPPAPSAVDAALPGCDWREVRHTEGSGWYQPGGVQLDLSAIAKGYAVDLAFQRLDALGLRHVMVEVGGEFRGQGMRPGGQPWWVELELPPTQGQTVLPFTRLALHGLSVATSGDYRRYYADADTRRAHSIDPRTGRPITHGLASVSVVHPECMWADGWATALTVLGLEPGLALAEKHNIAALFVQREADGFLRETLSTAMQRLAA